MASQKSELLSPVTPEEHRNIRRWRLLIVGLSLLLPLIALASARVIEVAEGVHGHPESWGDFALLPVIAVIFNWPFFILAATAKRTVVRFRPDARSAHLALAGGLAGLLVPYLLLWMAMTEEFVLNAANPNVGAGASLVGPPMAWATGGLLAYVGSKIGPRVFGWRSGPCRTPH
jgi:hypothetical protein